MIGKQNTTVINCIKIINLLFLLLLISSCEDKKKSKIISFNNFSIETPTNWSKTSLSGLDSQVGGIIINEKDTAFFDLGWYSKDVEQEETLFVFDSLEYTSTPLNKLIEKTKGNYVVVPTKKRKEYLKDSLKKAQRHIYYWDSIQCFKTKFFKPKMENGYTGIYIDSLKGNSINNNKIKFLFIGRDLNTEDQKKFLESLETIKFKSYCNNSNGTD